MASRRQLIVGGIGAAALTVLVGGAALAQTPTPGAGRPGGAEMRARAEQFLSAVAAKLGKTPAEVSAAFKAVEHDRVAQALKDGKLTQQQADAMNKRIDQSTGLGFMGGPGMHRGDGKGPGPGAGPGRGPGGGSGGMHGQAGPFGDVAGFLGIKPPELFQQLRGGKTLAQVAQDHGKSRDDLKTYLTTQLKNRLAQAVQSGRLTQAQADDMLKSMSGRLDQMIDRVGGGRPPGGGPGMGPRGRAA
jgi:AraC-like DNA-binding protein